MMFIATLEHTPDNCWARPENEEKAREWIAGMDQKAGEAGVEVRGSYVTPNEHRFYFILESDSFDAVSTFLGPPLLHDHAAHVAPVLTFGEAEEALLED